MGVVALGVLLANHGGTLGELLFGVIAGLLTNYVDRKLTPALREFFNQTDGVVNAEIEKALSRCFLRSLHSIAQECEQRLLIGSYRGQPNYQKGFESDGQWLARKLKQLTADLKTIETATPTAISFASLEEVQLLLQPNESKAEILALKQKLCQTVAESPVECYKTEVKASLVERMGALFAWEINHTETVRSAVQTQLLVQINAKLAEFCDRNPDFPIPAPLTVETLQTALSSPTHPIAPASFPQPDNLTAAMPTTSSPGHASFQAHPPASASEPQTGPEAPAIQPLSPPKSSAINPFDYGTPVSPDRFYGRRQAIADVRNRIGGMSAQCINIVGLRRNGKSSLLRYIQEKTDVFVQPSQHPLIVTLDLQDRKFHTPAGLLEGLRRGIARSNGEAPWSKQDNEDPFEVEDGLRRLCDRNQRLIILLDEFEAIGHHLDQFQAWGSDWRAKACAGLLTMVIASKRPIDDLYQPLELTSPFGNIFSTTILGALETDAWKTLVAAGFSSTSLADATLQWIDDLAGGLPYYTQLAAALLWQHRDPHRAQVEFIFQAHPRFQELWNDLTPQEQQTLRHAAGNSGVTAPINAIRTTLQRHGLLRPNGQLFSSAFASFIQK